MNIIKSIQKRKPLEFVLIALFICAFFVGLSFVGTEGDNKRISIKSEGFNQLHADAVTEPLWAGVRGAATFARLATISINGVVASLNNIFNLIDSYPIIVPDPIFTGQVGNFWYKLYRNTSISVDSRNYIGRLEIWKVNTGPVYVKALEFYWNDLANPTSSLDGVLLKIKPYFWDPNNFYPEELYEVKYLKDSSSNDTMIISFIADPNGQAASDPGFKFNETVPTYGGCLEKGMVRFTNVTASTWYEFAGVAKRECTCASFTEKSGTSFYSLAFLAYNTSPYNSVAKFGTADNDGSSNAPVWTLCGIANFLNYGYFNVNQGFVQDSVPSPNAAPAGVYPARTAVDSIEFDPSGSEFDITEASVEAKTIVFQAGDPI